MDKKTLTMLSFGVFCAAVICLVVGTIVFLTSGSNGIMYFTGIAMVCLGGAMGIIPFFILVWVLIARLFAGKDKNRTEDDTDNVNNG